MKLVNPILRGGGDDDEDTYAVPKLAGDAAGSAGDDPAVLAGEPAYVNVAEPEATYVNTATATPSNPDPEPEPVVTTEPAKTPGKLNLDHFNKASASARADKTSKTITAPQISGPMAEEAAEPKKTPVKRISRAEKQKMMEEEERQRSERITSALRNMGSVAVDPNFDPKEAMMDPDFMKARQDAKKEQEEREREEKERQLKTTTGWKSQAAGKKAARTAQPVKIKPELKVKQRIERERREAEEAAAKAAQDAKGKKEAEEAQVEKERKSKQKAEKLRVEREEMQEAMLAGLPAWKRDKILRDQKKEREHLATVTSEKVR